MGRWEVLCEAVDCAKLKRIVGRRGGLWEVQKGWGKERRIVGT